MSDPPSSKSGSGSVAGKLLEAIDRRRLPRHVAIIMDGNGRWARGRGLPRVAGHRAGIAAVRDTVEASAELGLEVLTLYAFSRENWKRPRAEVTTLMRLLKEYVKKELRTLLDNDIRFRPIGRIDDLSPTVQQAVHHAESETAGGQGLVFNIALSYGGRDEIIDSCRALAREAAAGTLDPEEIGSNTLERHLSTAGQPDPDLLIRTSGEMRVSNFLLWQIAYAEIWVTPTFWPDFRREELYRAILDYQKRERRYGGVIADPPRGSGPGRSIS
jgi:undecaprenyl diphosphate synthase